MYRSPVPAARVVLTVPMLPARVLGPAPALASYLEGDAVVFENAAGGPYALDAVTVEGASVESVHVDGAMVDDLWLTSDGARVHFRVVPQGDRAGAPGIVRVVFRGIQSGAEIAASARFETGPGGILVLPSGVATSPAGFYSGPAGPLRDVTVNADPHVHVGRWSWDEADLTDGDSVRSSWRRLQFDTWLDASVPGAVDAAPTVRIDAGRVEVDHWAGCLDGRHARIRFDPRNGARRLETGRHAVEITWRARARWRTTDHRASVYLVVGDDGTTELLRC